ncbi:Thiamine pyrophosphokinase [Lentilactobacillus buchneri subsp. silagei CD034]|uniref:Thiamine diphosphokinase n=1 Tax=Lentilactobacillus buchneri subsp. silagei CD034 TaxID=1071400 RepID=J9W193_LENBU|nr:Thiamine pyrophosphokinase [Lentilactobacillus buchneri subsp. silagei CD034]
MIERGIDPLVAIGDFDSLKPAELQLVRDHIKDIRQSIPEKDDTDTQLGLKVALQEHHADRLDIYGATGGRLDHFLANLWMVLEPRFKPYAPKIRMIDKQNTITFFLPGTYQIEKEPDKKYLAFVALTPMDHLTLFDEKYQLNDYQVKHPMSLASNEFVGETARFKFGSGVMCVIQSKDINRYN